MNNNQKNEVIARYMGGEYHSEEDYEVGSSAPINDYGWVFPKASAPPNYKVNPFTLKYNQSFDWLIPVVCDVYVRLIEIKNEYPNTVVELESGKLLARLLDYRWDLPRLFESTFSAITFLNENKEH